MEKFRSVGFTEVRSQVLMDAGVDIGSAEQLAKKPSTEKPATQGSAVGGRCRGSLTHWQIGEILRSAGLV